MKKNEAIDKAREQRKSGDTQSGCLQWYCLAMDNYEKAYTELKAQRVKDRDEVRDILKHYLAEDECFEACKWLDEIYKGVE